MSADGVDGREGLFANFQAVCLPEFGRHGPLAGVGFGAGGAGADVANFLQVLQGSGTVDGGRFESETFDAVFKRIGRSEFQKLIDKGDLDLVETVLTGWEGIADEAGKELPFTKSTLKEMLDDPYFTRGIIAAYLASLEGGKAKN